MPNQPVQIRDPDGRVLSIQKSALPVYLARDCEVVDASQAVDLPAPSAPKKDWVKAAKGLVPDAPTRTKTDLIDTLTPPDPPSSGTTNKEN